MYTFVCLMCVFVCVCMHICVLCIRVYECPWGMSVHVSLCALNDMSVVCIYVCMSCVYFCTILPRVKTHTTILSTVTM